MVRPKPNPFDERMFYSSFVSGPLQCTSHVGSMYLTSSTQTTTMTTSSSYPSTTSTHMFAHGSVPSFSWSQTVPAYMPWASKPETTTTGSSSSASIMRFTAPIPGDPCTSQTATTWELLHNLGANKCVPTQHQHLKRRIDSDEDLRPFKQYVTEEKMVARMNQLHISNNYSDPMTSSTVATTENGPISIFGTTMLSGEQNEGSDESEVLPGSLILSPELKKLVKSSDLFTEAIMEDMKKQASMAVVLWQPPGGTVAEKLQEARSEQYQECNNNNDSFFDINRQIPNSHNLSPQSEDIPKSCLLSPVPETSSFDNTDDTMDL